MKIDYWHYEGLKSEKYENWAIYILDFEKKWDDIQVFIQYGILTDEKFNEKVKSFNLLKNTDGKYFTTEEYKEKVKAAQTDKNDKLIYLYTHDADEHHSLIKNANDKGYDVIILDGPLASHYITKAEQEMGVSFARVDADTIDISDGFARSITDDLNIETESTTQITLSGDLDIGSEAADTWYAVHVVGDTNAVETPTFIFSLRFLSEALYATISPSATISPLEDICPIVRCEVIEPDIFPLSSSPVSNVVPTY